MTMMRFSSMFIFGEFRRSDDEIGSSWRRFGKGFGYDDSSCSAQHWIRLFRVGWRCWTLIVLMMLFKVYVLVDKQPLILSGTGDLTDSKKKKTNQQVETGSIQPESFVNGGGSVYSGIFCF